MKHNPKVTILLLCMFLITQLIGLAVINAYSQEDRDLPFGMEPPEEMREQTGINIMSIAISLVIAVSLVLILMKIKAKILLRFWFFFVIILALAITFYSLLMQFGLSYTPYIALALALPLAYLKVFRRNFIVHNFSELLIYPGIATIFVMILNIWSALILLLLLSVYDIYAVWHTGFMQKMAKYQIDEVKVFNGFFVPYTDKKTKNKIKKLKKKYKNNKDKLKKQEVRINLGILGGGDIAFPLIMTGVVFLAIGLLPALSVSIFSTIALALLLMFSKKGEFYPAMPFITTGCLAGLLFGYLIYIL